MIQNLIFGILFLKILFQAYSSFVFICTFRWALSEFFLISNFLAESWVAKPKKLAKKITYFTTQLCSKNLTHFTKLNSLDIESNMLLQQSYKPFSLFQQPYFCLMSEKNICTAPFLDAQELHSWDTLNANVSIFLYISTRRLLPQRRSKIWTSGVRLWLNLW